MIDATAWLDKINFREIWWEKVLGHSKAFLCMSFASLHVSNFFLSLSSFLLSSLCIYFSISHLYLYLSNFLCLSIYLCLSLSISYTNSLFSISCFSLYCTISFSLSLLFFLSLSSPFFYFIMFLVFSSVQKIEWEMDFWASLSLKWFSYI